MQIKASKHRRKEGEGGRKKGGREKRSSRHLGRERKEADRSQTHGDAEAKIRRMPRSEDGKTCVHGRGKGRMTAEGEGEHRNIGKQIPEDLLAQSEGTQNC